MNAGASTSAGPSPMEGSGTAWVLLGSWALSPARPTPIHPRHECRGFSALLGEYLDEKGNKRTVKTKISANYELGLPITSDLDYYRAFLKICDEIVDRDGRFRMPITVPTSTIIRYAGKTENARVWREVREWFDRMTGTLIKGWVFRAKHRNYEEGFTGTVFSQVVMRGERLRSGKLADTNYVWLS